MNARPTQMTVIGNLLLAKILLGLTHVLVTMATLEMAAHALVSHQFLCSTCTFSSCVVVDCGEYPRPDHAVYLENTGTQFQQGISVQCLPEADPQDITTATCQANGKWSALLNSCTCKNGTWYFFGFLKKSYWLNM